MTKLLCGVASPESFFSEKFIGRLSTEVSYSAAIQQKKLSGGPAVRNVAAHLFRTFIRMVDDAKRKENILEESVREHSNAQVCSFAYSALACLRMGMSGSAPNLQLCLSVRRFAAQQHSGWRAQLPMLLRCRVHRIRSSSLQPE
jgi:hypothetical protein